MGRWFTPSKSDHQSGAQYNALYTAASSSATAPETTGDLTPEENQEYANKRLFRLGTFFTSPTGALNSSPRRGSKLIGG